MSYSQQLDGKTIVITGGTGSFGHQMIYELMSYDPKKIIVFSRDEEKQNNMRMELSNHAISKKIEYFIGDVRDYDRLYTATKNANIIFHAAAMKQVSHIEHHPFEAVKTNVNGAYNVIKAAVENKVRNVVGITTDKAVKPINAMGMTKAIQEKIMLSDDLAKDGTIVCCVRYGNVLGSRGSVMPLFDEKIRKKEPLPITHPNMTRFMLTLAEAIQLVFYSLKHSQGGEIFVKNCPIVRITDFAKAYAEIKTGNANYPLEFVGIRPGERMYEVLVTSEEMRRTVKQDDHFIIKRQKYFYDSESLKHEESPGEYSTLNEKPVSFEELKQLISKMKWIS